MINIMEVEVLGTDEFIMSEFRRVRDEIYEQFVNFYKINCWTVEMS